MNSFDRILMVDWSGGNDRGPKPVKDAIWIGEHHASGSEQPRYFRNRQEAELWIGAQLDRSVAAGQRVLVGFDFPFGYPQGFSRAVTGSSALLDLWRWLEAQIEDRPEANNRFDLAGKLNGLFPAPGPFWGNGLARDITGLPRKKSADRLAGAGVAEWREVEHLAKGAFSCWQLAGAGAVGSQVLMGLPVLARLHRRYAGLVAAWPFEPWQDAQVVLAEVFPSLLADEVRAAQQSEPDTIRDALQVRLLASTLWIAQVQESLEAILDAVPEGAPRNEEGWIVGVGAEAALRAATRPDLAPPKLKNDCFALPQGVDWTPVDDALGYLRAALSPVTRVETCATSEAAGRVLAKDAVAVRSNPPGANSAVDGYGFAAASIGPAGRQILPLVADRAAAGAPFPGALPSGKAVRILTGALLPEGVDTVILEEDTAEAPDVIAFEAPVKTGANTRRAGEDVDAGAVALPAGRVLTPADLALLSALGLPSVSVRSRLRVGVLSTGDEIVAPGSNPDPSCTYDANRPMLLAIAERWGHMAVDLGHVGDDRTCLRARLDSAVAQADVILTSGGASAGDEDHVSALLREAGAMQTWRIAIKPGRPLALGLWNGVPVFGLPGNPVAAFVCTLVFAQPALAQLSGAAWPEPQSFNLPAAFEKRKKPGRREFQRARIGTDGRVEVFASEGSGRISGLSWAEGLVDLPHGAAHVRPGDLVRFLPYGSFGL